MANLLKRSGGYKAVQYKHPEGRRRTVAVGKLTVRQANAVATKIESLAASVASGAPLDMETAGWLGGIGDDLHGRLAEQGLVQPRSASISPTIREVYDEYDSKRQGVKWRTRNNWKQGVDSLCECFGDRHTARSVSVADAEDFEQWLIGKGYALATIRKRIGVSKMLWKWATKRGHVDTNPFADLRSTAVATEHKYYVTPEETAAVLDACPDTQWRLIFGLARFAGLRIPSELMPLRWSDINWSKKQIRVRSPKTEAHAGHAERQVPLFPELQPLLLTAFEEAPEGAEYVISAPRLRANTSAYLRKRMRQIITDAGIEPWRRVFHNMRATRQTELSQHYPGYAVRKWIGNSEQVAEQHYLMVTEDLMTKAATTALHQALQHPAETACTKVQAKSKKPGFARACTPVQEGAGRLVPPRGLEPLLPR